MVEDDDDDLAALGFGPPEQAAASTATSSSLPGTSIKGVRGPFHSLLHLDMDDEPTRTLMESLSGAPSRVWRTVTYELQDGHIISITRGPVSCAIDAAGAFKKTFQRPIMSRSELKSRLASPQPPLKLVSVRDLVPPELVSIYDSILKAEAEGQPLSELPSEVTSYRPAEPPPTPPGSPPPAIEYQRQESGKTPSWFNEANAGGQRPMGYNDPFGGGPMYQPPRSAAQQGHDPPDDCIVS